VKTLTERVYHLSPPYGLFDGTVVRNLFYNETEGARKLLLHRAVRAGEILRLKPGLYMIAPKFRKEPPHSFILAAVLHFPSHISLESALAFHGLIPEAVFSVSCVSPSRGRTYRTPAGIFSFYRVSHRFPWAGVRAVKVGQNGWAFIAEPLRAVADMVFVNKQICWSKDGMGYLIESLRIDPDDLVSMDFSSLEEIVGGFSCRRTRIYLDHMAKELMG